ncbi:hypothetical protein [Bradyrhizobium sp. CCBAU 25360]|uniref:hypothetical protein n=1 Tax=Bradyrhizobium sp. CCBAU 25360 TaxID=858425 RepID=UPI002305BA8B|nr:hypothetical protein [Bradyrhizobium sp. CCBAU 25360]
MIASFGLPTVGQTDADGRELVVSDGTGELYVRLRDEQAARRPAALVPLDSMSELRAEVAPHFVRRLAGQRTCLRASLRSRAGGGAIHSIKRGHWLAIFKALARYGNTALALSGRGFVHFV